MFTAGYTVLQPEVSFTLIEKISEETPHRIVNAGGDFLFGYLLEKDLFFYTKRELSPSEIENQNKNKSNYLQKTKPQDYEPIEKNHGGQTK